MEENLYKVDEQYLIDIADAIRAQTGSSTNFWTVDEFPNAIRNIVNPIYTAMPYTIVNLSNIYNSRTKQNFYITNRLSEIPASSTLIYNSNMTPYTDSYNVYNDQVNSQYIILCKDKVENTYIKDLTNCQLPNFYSDIKTMYYYNAFNLPFNTEIDLTKYPIKYDYIDSERSYGWSPSNQMFCDPLNYPVKLYINQNDNWCKLLYNIFYTNYDNFGFYHYYGRSLIYNNELYFKHYDNTIPQIRHTNFQTAYNIYITNSKLTQDFTEYGNIYYYSGNYYLYVKNNYDKFNAISMYAFYNSNFKFTSEFSNTQKYSNIIDMSYMFYRCRAGGSLTPCCGENTKNMAFCYMFCNLLSGKAEIKNNVINAANAYAYSSINGINFIGDSVSDLNYAFINTNINGTIIINGDENRCRYSNTFSIRGTFKDTKIEKIYLTNLNCLNFNDRYGYRFSCYDAFMNCFNLHAIYLNNSIIPCSLLGGSYGTYTANKNYLQLQYILEGKLIIPSSARCFNSYNWQTLSCITSTFIDYYHPGYNDYIGELSEMFLNTVSLKGNLYFNQCYELKNNIDKFFSCNSRDSSYLLNIFIPNNCNTYNTFINSLPTLMANYNSSDENMYNWHWEYYDKYYKVDNGWYFPDPKVYLYTNAINTEEVL